MKQEVLRRNINIGPYIRFEYINNNLVTPSYNAGIHDPSRVTFDESLFLLDLLHLDFPVMPCCI